MKYRIRTENSGDPTQDDAQIAALTRVNEGTVNERDREHGIIITIFLIIQIDSISACACSVIYSNLISSCIM